MPKKLMTQAEYARHRGVSREAVRKAVAARRIRLTRAGMIDVAATDAAWTRNTDPSTPTNSVSGNPKLARPRRRRPGKKKASPKLALVKPKPSTPEAPEEEADPHHATYYAARAKRQEMAAQREQMEMDADRGKLVEREVYLEVAALERRKARDLLLAIPERIQERLAAWTEPQKCGDLVRSEIELALRDLGGD